MTKGRRNVSQARLHQKSGTSFRGYKKVQTSKSTFRMKATGKGKK